MAKAKTSTTTGNTGRVKFFNESKGFGFLIDDKDLDEKNEPKQYFFHFSGTLDRVTQDDLVSYEIEIGDRGPKAVRVARVKNPI